MKPEPETQKEKTPRPHGDVATIIADQERQLEVARRRVEDLTRENARLASELEAHAWKISPGMAQAKIDQLNAEVEQLQAVLGNTRAAATYAMDEIRSVLGVVPGRHDSSSKRVVDYVREQVDKVQFVLEANARAGERIREEQQRTERAQEELRKAHELIFATYGALTPDGCDLPPSGINSMPEKVRALRAALAEKPQASANGAGGDRP